VIAHLLEIMTNKKIRGIDRRPRNPLAISANLSILWAHMKKQEHIELGGINTTGAHNCRTVNALDADLTSHLRPCLCPFADISKGNEKIVLSLVWRYIVKYDLDDPDGVTATNGHCQSVLAAVPPDEPR